MPVCIDLANLIFNKKSIEEKYLGGSAQFRIDWKIGESKRNQEDDELFLIAKMNLDEFDIDRISKAGLTYSNSVSDDFVAVSRYGGSLWEVDWIEQNAMFAWHINCSQEQKDKAIYHGEKLTMEEIADMEEKGIDVYATIKSEETDEIGMIINKMREIEPQYLSWTDEEIGKQIKAIHECDYVWEVNHFKNKKTGLLLNIKGLSRYAPEGIKETYESVWSKDSFENVERREKLWSHRKKQFKLVLYFLISFLLYFYIDYIMVLICQVILVFLFLFSLKVEKN